jgi:hypothetical protein
MANFLILAHFNGANGSTTITNENGSGPALVFGGAGALTTGNSPPFGTAWADLTGANSRAETSTPISLTAPWCISVKMNLGGFTGCIVSIGDENTPGSLLIQRYAGDFEIREITPGPTLNQFAFTNTNGIASNTTQLLTISCDSSNLVTVAVDGASKCTGTPINTTFSGILRVGGRNSGGVFGGQATGYYDELAVIDDDAYYTSYPFTPPASEYTMPASGVTGTVAWTEADDTAAVAGSVGASGTAGWTEANDSASLTGSLTASASVAWTESNDTASLTGQVTQPASGTIAWVEADDPWSLTGTSAVSDGRTSGGSGGGRSQKARKKTFNYDYSSPKEPEAVEQEKPAKAPVKAVTKKEKKSIPADVAEMMQLLESSQSVTAQVLAEQKAMRAAEERLLAEEMELMAVIAQIL